MPPWYVWLTVFVLVFILIYLGGDEDDTEGE